MSTPAPNSQTSNEQFAKAIHEIVIKKEKKFTKCEKWLANDANINNRFMFPIHMYLNQPTTSNVTYESALSYAVRARRLDLVTFLLRNKADPESRDNADKTPLMHACGNGVANSVSGLKKYFPIIRELLKFKANPNATDKDGRCPMYYTFSTFHKEFLNGQIVAAELIAKLLVNNGFAGEPTNIIKKIGNVILTDGKTEVITAVENILNPLRPAIERNKAYTEGALVGAFDRIFPAEISMHISTFFGGYVGKAEGMKIAATCKNAKYYAEEALIGSEPEGLEGWDELEEDQPKRKCVMQ
ncbi:ankyrin repeat domain-containing protein [Legionella fallonii]|nr:ankyrin repeat domain-containing protein [Legionella fallonii]